MAEVGGSNPPGPTSFTGSWVLTICSCRRHPNDRSWRIVYALIVANAMFGCGDPAPTQTNLSALATSQVAFNGRHVIVSGTLRTFDAPRHYWIENEDLDRVALEGADNLEPLVGQTVEVSGIFVYDRNAGRRIEVIQLRTLP